MGKKLSTCCKGGSSPYKQKESQYNLTAAIQYDETMSSLQHISEREPMDDADYDPSTNPTAGPLFLERFENNVKNLNKNNVVGFYRLKRSSSCSTIFIDDCTVSHPDFKNMIKCVSMAVYYHIHSRRSDVVLDIFDERTHPLDKNMSITDVRDPDFRSIYRFMRTLFGAAQLSSECAIITLVYLERLLTYAEIDIVPSTWRRILLGSILLASKVWDDQAVWNVDYCQILRDTTVDDMNELERRILELLQFNINVPSSIYVKYYFELRKLADNNDLTFPAEPLTESRAQKLEATSRVCDKNFFNLRHNLKRSSSHDSIPFQRKSLAIIS
ncbi:hypothetical protein RDWZM_008022 [Blomia tropicalis]|uniref:Cyclin-like domain-containing protein n=1 Tax=Blomia tropicalis TaxID=40697 RepID=A0A9Q0RJZ2_BLOTA|nr:hypothetical protein BLOT_003694 [Blomia tropicalis]KAJ6216865.1 hypothetical protein RDWZM_008022 [Blomia tropicalis]